MNRISNFIDRNIVMLLIVFLWIQPLINLFTSLMVRFFDIDLTFGILIRSIALLIVGFYSLFFIRGRFRKLSLLFVSAVVLFSVIYIFNNIIFKDPSVLFAELKYLIKAFYFPLMLLFMLNIFEYKKADINISHFIFSVYVYIAIIFVASITNTGFVTYNGAKLGNVGWFYAANEIGTIITVAYPLVLFWAIGKGRRIIPYVILITYSIICLLIGTKVPLLGILLSLFSAALFFFLKFILIRENKNIRIVIFPIVFLILLVVLILPSTPSGINLNMHLKFVNVNSFNDFWGNWNDDYSTHKEDNKVGEGGIDEQNTEEDEIVNTPNPQNVVYSGRNNFVKVTKENYRESNWWLKLTGIGFIENYGLDSQKIKAVEMDFHDIFYRFGILGFIIYLIVPVALIFNYIKNFIYNVRENCANNMIACYTISITLGFGIAYIAGHVLTAPAVSIYLVYIMLLLNNEVKSDLEIGDKNNEKNMD